MASFTWNMKEDIMLDDRQLQMCLEQAEIYRRYAEATPDEEVKAYCELKAEYWIKGYMDARLPTPAPHQRPEISRLEPRVYQ